MTVGHLRVVLVDDESVIRDALHDLLTDVGADVVGEACNGREAIDVVISVAPDVVLMDVRMSSMDGLAATRVIKERAPDVRVVLFTAYEDPSLKQQAADAGADAYLLKGMLAQDLVAALREQAAL